MPMNRQQEVYRELKAMQRMVNKGRYKKEVARVVLAFAAGALMTPALSWLLAG